MAANNNTTVTFLAPLPDAVWKRVQAIIEANELSDTGWDEDVADVGAMPTGLTTLFGRNVAYDTGNELLKLAKKHSFSVVIHCEDFGSEEPAVYLRACEAGTGRQIDCLAPAGETMPLVPIDAVMSRSRDDLMHDYGLPVDIAAAMEKQE